MSDNRKFTVSRLGAPVVIVTVQYAQPRANEEVRELERSIYDTLAYHSIDQSRPTPSEIKVESLND